MTLPDEAYAAALTALPGMGPRRLHSLLARFDPDEAWRVARRGRPPEGLDLGTPDPARLAAAWAAAPVDPAATWAGCRRLGVGVHVLGAPTYPAALAGDPEPPAVLFALGTLDALERVSVAIVGTRRCTPGGRLTARELGAGLSGAGIAVVSGLAAGIDGAAHEGVLASGGTGPPVGVVGSGLDVVYPSRHEVLWRRVAADGVLLSEAPPGARPARWRFPARNRVLAALADVVVVVESHARGGSRHTVDAALDRDIPVLAVPGSVRNPAAAGTNQLLADGAAPARDVDDVLVALGSRRAGAPAPATATPCSAPSLPALRPMERSVLEAFAGDPATVDGLSARTGFHPAGVTAALVQLESLGLAAEAHGWWWAT